LADFFACDGTRIQPRRRPLDAHNRQDAVSHGVPCHAAQVKSGTVEAEITVPRRARQFLRKVERSGRPFGPWRRDHKDGRWWLERPDSVPRGRICVYGPWVLDTGHGNHPEIHPAEMVFWNAGVDHDQQGPYFMMLLQDASGRFGHEQGYRLTHAPGERWRPWSQGPIHGRFEVAVRFEHNAHFDLTPLVGRVGATREWSFHGTAADPQALGEPLLKIASTVDLPACPPDRDERRPRDARGECLSLHLKDVAIDGGQYRALLVIEAIVGGPEPWQEGALVLRLDSARAAAPAPERVAKAAAARAAYTPLPPPEQPTHHLAWDAAAASIDWREGAFGEDDLRASLNTLHWASEATAPTALADPKSWSTTARFDLWASRWQVRDGAQRPGDLPPGLREAALKADRSFDWSGVRCLDLATRLRLECQARPQRGARTTLTVTGTARGLVQVEIPVSSAAAVKVWPSRVNLRHEDVWSLLDQVCPPSSWPDALSPSVPSVRGLVRDFVVRLGPHYTVDEIDFLVKKADDVCRKDRTAVTR
jgi:hypothetical protein